MRSNDHERVNALVVARPLNGGNRRMRGGIIVTAFMAAVVVAMAGWLYLLSRVMVTFCIWLFT
jgi:hypothetical protein